MDKLFDKITGTITSYNSTGITDNSAEWVEGYYQGWYVTLDNIEYKITGNTTTSLYFSNSISSNLDYSIAFVGRTFLTELESDASNTTKISDDLISKKYNQCNTDINNKVFAYLRDYYTTSFDPLANILNIIIIQQAFAYCLLSKIYQDLMIDQESFEGFKGYNMYEKSYNEGIKDALALIQLDLNQDGEADPSEKTQSASTYQFLTR